MDVISFQKIFGLCGLKCHIVEIWRDVTFEDRGRTDGRTDNGNVNIVLESAKQDSQYELLFGNIDLLEASAGIIITSDPPYLGK